MGLPGLAATNPSSPDLGQPGPRGLGPSPSAGSWLHALSLGCPQVCLPLPLPYPVSPRPLPFSIPVSTKLGWPYLAVAGPGGWRTEAKTRMCTGLYPPVLLQAHFMVNLQQHWAGTRDLRQPTEDSGLCSYISKHLGISLGAL